MQCDNHETSLNRGTCTMYCTIVVYTASPTAGSRLHSYCLLRLCKHVTLMEYINRTLLVKESLYYASIVTSECKPLTGSNPRPGKLLSDKLISHVRR
jgi:hypothetical protein